MIIISQMRMTNQPEQPDSWAFIENLDLEQEIQPEQQTNLFVTCRVALWTKLEASGISKIGASTT
jgi:hypothetical protein